MWINLIFWCIRNYIYTYGALPAVFIIIIIIIYTMTSQRLSMQSVLHLLRFDRNLKGKLGIPILEVKEVLNGRKWHKS